MPVSAPRNYSPGEVIYTETPFVWVLPNALSDILCQSCSNRGFNLRNCKQCSAVKYCGKACQKKDWKHHCLECKNMAKLPDKDNYDFVRLVGKVILKIKDKDWKQIKTTVLGNEISFDDIDPHYKDMTENTYLNLMYKEMKEDVAHFIGAENMPKDIDCLKIVGKVVSNTYMDVKGAVASISFYLGTSQFEAECIANSSFSTSSKGLKIWSSKGIKKGSDKITIEKRKHLGEVSLSRLLDVIAKQTCKCTDCSLPYGESVLTKILDDKKAFSIIRATETVLKLADVIPGPVKIELEGTANEILEKHLGALGRTNVLHLKLLALRYIEIGGRATEIKDDLEDLEIIMSSVFGEFYSEMLKIYRTLAIVNFHLGNVLRGKIYWEKAGKLDRLLCDP